MNDNMAISDKAATRYPILMLHGMGFRDYKHINYWGRVPEILKANGAKVFYGYQDSNASIEENAHQIEKQLLKIFADTSADKVNIIAHSKGGLEARYLISTLKYAERIASLTTLSTPHNGSLTVDSLLKLPKVIIKTGCSLIDLWFRILGDKKPNTYSAINSFLTENAKEFNLNNPDSEAVYYQSYAFVMNNAFSDISMCIPWLVVHHYEGDNDGLLAPRATKWSNFKGVYKGRGNRGISHCDEIDMRRYRLTKRQGEGIGDITEFYLEIVGDLKQLGF